MKLRRLALRAVLACATLSSLAAAQPGGAAQAEALFKRGKELLAKGDYAEACDAFDASQKLDPTPSTRLNQAGCREKNNQLATAWGHFLEAEREARALTTPEGKQLQKIASTRAAALEKRVSTLQINVPADVRKLPGLEIWRNRDAVDPATLNAPLPIDGGTYTIAIRSLKSREWTTTISVANEKDAKTVDVPIIVETKAPPPPTDVDTPPTTPEHTTPGIPEERVTPVRMERPMFGGVRYVALTFGAIGIGGLVFGAVRGSAAQGKQSDAQALCPDPATPCENGAAATQLTYDGHDLATQANISFAVGGGLVAVGVLLWFIGRPDAEPVSDLAITPAVHDGGATVSLSGAW